jgi:transcriptional regulator with XRE-family HTH domain
MSKEIEIVECEIVSNKLIEAMARKGLSQERCAQRARMTTRQLGRIMKGQNCPSLKKAWALSLVLEQPLETLFRFKVKTRRAVTEKAA